MENPFRRLSKAPTNPHAHASSAAPGDASGASGVVASLKTRAFDVEDLYRGPLGDNPDSAEALGLDEKLRQAYFWIVNTAIISPHYDIEFHEGASPEYQLGDSKARLVLPSGRATRASCCFPCSRSRRDRSACSLVGPGEARRPVHC